MTQPARRHPAVLEEDLGEELLLYTAQRDVVHVLNATGRAVWRLCDGNRTIQEIAQKVSHSFATSPEQNIEEDVKNVLESLAERRLVIR